MLEERLGRIRATDPKKFALFTGRDQMQALTGLFARQFGTPNYAAHGGFCSVNMAAGMIYTIGGSFWEFGGPDLDRAKLFVMIGTAEDHHSNPLKIAISKFKRDGGRFISINPMRTGYSAIADEWVPIRPGTDGALLLALIHEIMALGLLRPRIPRALHQRRAARQPRRQQRRFRPPGARRRAAARPGSRTRVPADPAVVGPHLESRRCRRTREGADPCLLRRVHAARRHAASSRCISCSTSASREYTPEWAAEITGIPAATIRRLAQEMGVTARDQKIELPISVDRLVGREHDTVTGNPVAFHAMRGLAAHSNGFQTIRALAILMSLLGTIDRPGGFRHKAPFPRDGAAVGEAAQQPARGPARNTPLGGLALGWPASPRRSLHRRRRHAGAHRQGVLVGVPARRCTASCTTSSPTPGAAIRTAIDTLLIFMANMAWNSTMNTSEVRKMLNDKRRGQCGEYKIPFLVVCDAFQSETTAFADLVLPDTTYLERHDVMSMLDRPISEFDGPIDSVRVPVVPPKGECKPFQEVLIELAGAAQVSGVRPRRRHAQVPRLSRLHRQLRDRAGLGHRLSLRLARQGRRQVPAGRAEPAAVGDVREEQLRLPPPAAAVVPVHAQLEPAATWSGRSACACAASPSRS